jgi:hypothetical protein
MLHDSPPFPHAVAEPPIWHFPVMSQHPPQFSGPHTLPSTCPPSGSWHELKSHVDPDGHAKHCWPPNPHANGASPGWQMPLLSQQPPHVNGPHALASNPPSSSSQKDCPPSLMQPAPGGHAKQNCPSEPQAFGFSPDSHWPFMSQHPGHVAGEQPWGCTQKPPEKPPLSHVRPGGHARHSAPPAPHAPVLVPLSH